MLRIDEFVGARERQQPDKLVGGRTARRWSEGGPPDARTNSVPPPCPGGDEWADPRCKTAKGSSHNRACTLPIVAALPDRLEPAPSPRAVGMGPGRARKPIAPATNATSGNPNNTANGERSSMADRTARERLGEKA